MLCNWSSTAANISLRRAVQCKPQPLASVNGSRPTNIPWTRGHKYSSAHSFSANYPPFMQYPSFRSFSSKASLALTVKQPIMDPPSSTYELHSAPMTKAQMSRAASQAVRLCARSGSFTDALFVVNSLHYSMHHDPQISPPLPDTGVKSERMVPIKFGQAVSPRLSAHCFLHALIRAGHAKRAARYAELMMKQGIRLRTMTIDTIVDKLCLAPQTLLEPGALRLRRAPPGKDDANILRLVSERVADPCSRAAIRIIQHAEKFGHQRTERMYQTVISTCLMQGEIIVASLLFVLLVKSWQISPARVARHADSQDSLLENDVVQLHPAARKHLLEVPYPSAELMSMILQDVEHVLSRDQEPPTDETVLQAPLQALANLAMLVEHDHIHFGRISPLIRTLYSCPKMDHQVWILHKGQPKRVKAYPYFQRVLIGVITAMKSNSLTIPRLDLRSYNALLFYALRHRLSPSMASTVLEHMCVKRDPPISPDTKTYNILLRSGTLLRKVEMSNIVVNALQRSQPLGHIDHKDAPSPKSASEERMPGDSKTTNSLVPVLRYSNFTKVLQRLRQEDFIVPDVVLVGADQLQMDSSTLTSYIAHLTSTGKPHLVTELLFQLLPELDIIDHPSRRTDHRGSSNVSREAGIKRAASYGPRFFAVILNALTKAGKTGLAERVWILAQQAQRASWIPGFVPGVEPWCLSVHAYTSMMQCYAAEASKGVIRMRRYGTLSEDVTEWKPTSKHVVRGWARFVFIRQQLRKDRSRHTTGRRMGLLLYRSLLSGGESVFKSFSQATQTDGEPQPPIALPLPTPDVRFFNAALDLFGRQRYMYARAQHSTRARWKRRLRFSKLSYERRGTVSRFWSDSLQEVVEGMVAAGHTIPPGFLHLFIGRWFPSPSKHHSQKALNRSPYAYPPAPKDTFRSHAISTTKCRGLPVRRDKYDAQRRTQ